MACTVNEAALAKAILAEIILSSRNRMSENLASRVFDIMNKLGVNDDSEFISTRLSPMIDNINQFLDNKGLADYKIRLTSAATKIGNVETFGVSSNNFVNTAVTISSADLSFGNQIDEFVVGSKIDNVSISKLFGNSLALKDKTLNRLERQIFNSVVFSADINNPIVLADGTELGQSLMTYRNELATSLRAAGYVDATGNIISIEEFLQLHSQTLQDRASDLDNHIYRHYGDLVIYNRFDDIIQYLSSNDIKVLPALKNDYNFDAKAVVKYTRSNLSKIRTDWTDIAVINYDDEVSSYFKPFIRQIPLYNGKAKQVLQDRYLNHYHIYNAVKFLKNSPRYNNMSNLDAFNLFIKDYRDKPVTGVTLDFYNYIYSYLDYVYKNPNSLKNVTNKLNGTGVFSSKLLEIIESSLDELNIVEYSQVLYDWNEGGLVYTTATANRNTQVQSNIIKDFSIATLDFSSTYGQGLKAAGETVSAGAFTITRKADAANPTTLSYNGQIINTLQGAASLSRSLNAMGVTEADAIGLLAAIMNQPGYTSYLGNLDLMKAVLQRDNLSKPYSVQALFTKVAHIVINAGVNKSGVSKSNNKANNIFANNTALLNVFVTLTNEMTGEVLKTTVRSVEREMLPTFGLPNLINSMYNVYADNKTIMNANETPGDKMAKKIGFLDTTATNLFRTEYDRGQNLASNMVVRNGLKSVESIATNPSMSFIETFKFNFDYAFLHNLVSGAGRYDIDFTTFSDKSRNSLLSFDAGTMVTVGESKVNLLQMSNKELVSLLDSTYGQSVRAIATNLYNALVEVKAINHKPLKKAENFHVIIKKLTELQTQLKADADKEDYTRIKKIKADLDAANIEYVSAVFFDKFTLNSTLIEDINTLHKDVAGLQSHVDVLMDRAAGNLIKEGYLLEFDKEKMEMVIEKMFKFDEIGEIKAKMASFRRGNFYTLKNKAGEINPVFAKYMLVTNLISQNMQAIGVGTIYAHGGGSRSDRFVKMVKRMVSWQATYHNYHLGKEKGVDNFTKTLHVTDPEVVLPTINGVEGKWPHTDGASETLMLQRIFENNSLPGSGGVHHKSILMTSDPRFGAAGLTKHAAFAITNERLRETSEFKGNRNYRAIVQNMMGFNISHIKENLLTTKYRKPITGPIYHTPVEGSDLVYARRIEYLGDNSYRFTDSLGANIANEGIIQVNTLYDLYQLLGGWNTLGKVDRPSRFKYADSYYEYDDSSWYELADIVSTHTNAKVVKDLRGAFIGRVDFTNSIKVGIKNTVRWEDLSSFRGEGFFANRILKVSNRNAGIQLNPEHHIEDSQLSLPTQVLSSLIFNSKTTAQAIAAFEAINTYTKVAITEFSVGTNITPEQKALLVSTINSIFLDEGKSDDPLSAINEVIDLVKKGVIGTIPAQSADIQTKLKNTLINYFVKKGIRAKMAGIMGVLSPSETIMELYHVPVEIYRQVMDKTKMADTNESFVTLRYSEYQKFLVHARELPGFVATSEGRYGIKTPAKRTHEEGLVYENFFETTVHSSNIKMYDHVVHNGEIIEVLDFETYYNIQNSNQDVIRIHGIPSGLRGGDINWKIDMNGTTTTMSLYDIDEVKILSVLNKLLDKKDFTHIMFLDEVKLTQALGDKKFNYVFNNDPELKDEIIKLSKDIKKKFKDWNKLPFIQANTIIQDIIKTRMDAVVAELKAGNYKGNKVYNYNVREYQVGIPNIHYEKLGLSRNDSINTITPELIEKRYAEKIGRIDKLSDGLLLFDASNREGHIYFTSDIKVKNNSEYRKSNMWIKTEDGKKMLIDGKGNAVAVIPEGVEVFMKGNSTYFYVGEGAKINDVIAHFGIAIGPQVPGTYGKLRESIKHKSLYNLKEARELNNAMRAKIKKDSEAMYVSFKQTLKYTMARIPAQAFQSYTGVKAAYFVESEENTLTVAPAILMYSGADMDIDKAFCVGFGLDYTGKFYRWSNAHILKEGFFEAGLKLPVPDQDKVINYDESAPIDLFPELAGVIDLETLEEALSGIQDLERYKQFVSVISDGYKGLNVDPSWKPIFDIYNAQQVTLDAVKNFVAYSVNEVINDPANIRFAQTAIDPDVVSALIDRNSDKMKENKTLDPMDPTSIIKQKIANMVGKEVIGIVASSIKVFSAVTTAYNTIKANPNRTPAEVAALLLKPVKMDNTYSIYEQKDIGAMFAILTNIEPNEYIPIVEQAIRDHSMITDFKPTVKGKAIARGYIMGDIREDQLGKTTNNDFIAAKLEILLEQLKFASKNRDLFQHDGSIYLSSFLTLATDNAKELALFPLNAGPDTASFYTYGLMLGIPMHSLVSFMTSNAISLVTEAGKPDRFTTTINKLSVNKGFTTWAQGLNVKQFGGSFRMFFAGQFSEEAGETIVGTEFLPRLNEFMKALEKNNISLEGSKDGKAIPMFGTKFKDFLGNGQLFNFLFLNKINYIDSKGKPQQFYITADEVEAALQELIHPTPAPKVKKGKKTPAVPETPVEDVETSLPKNLQEFYERVIYLKRINERQAKDGVLPMEWILNVDNENGHKFTNKVMESFNSITQGTNQATSLSSVLKINQGITTHAYDLYRYEHGINKVFTKTGSYQQNGLRQFLNSPEDATDIIDNASKSFINIPAIISNNPSFAGQLNVLGSYENTMDIISKYPDVLARIHTTGISELPSLEGQTEALKKLEDEPIVSFMHTNWDRETLTEEGFMAFNEYMNDIVNVMYLEQEPNLEIQVEVKDQSGEPTGQYKTLSLNLGIYEDRKTFVEWFSNTMLREMKRRYSEEALVAGLSYDAIKDKITGVENFVVKPKVDMTNTDSPQVQSTIAAMQTSFARLSLYKVDNVSIGDAFFYYNLIVNKNKNKKGALTRIINPTMAIHSTQDNPTKYSEYLNYMNSIANQETSDEIFNKIDIKDLAFYGVIPIVKHHSDSRMYLVVGKDGKPKFKGPRALAKWMNENVDFEKLQNMYIPIHSTIQDTDSLANYEKIYSSSVQIRPLKEGSVTIKNSNC